MNRFIDINTFEKTVFFLLVIISLLMVIMLFMNHRQEKRLFPFALADFACGFIAYIGFNMVVVTMSNRYEGMEIRGFRVALVDKPVILYLLVQLSVLLALIALYREDHRWREKHISINSIKESIDYIPYGMCCYYEEGMPRLINRSMNQIAIDLFGKPISNAAEFWDKLNSLQETEYARKIEGKELPVWVGRDNRAWSFKREKIPFRKGFLYEILASDITEEYEKSEKLSEENKRMKLVTEKLKEYSQNVTRLTIEKEILDAKIKVHSELGQTLVATRRYLSDKDIDKQELLDMWNKNIKLLKKEGLSIEADDYEILKANAEQLGITLSIDSELPKDETVKEIIISSVNECITNAYKYSESKQLELKAREDTHEWIISIANPGAKPKEAIIEKGGLKNLRNKIESKGGRMEITTEPCFSIVIALKC